MTLHPDSSVPLYIQLKKLLQARMQSGTYPEGSRLPSERELAQSFNVSRMTARQALQLLAQEGLTYSRVGKGTYVSARKIDQQLRFLTSFTEEMERLGMKASSRVLLAEVQPAPPDIADQLQIPAASEIAMVRRVRLADHEPLAVETSYLVHDLCPGILEAGDFSRDSLYEVLRNRYGWALVRAEQKIAARLPQHWECEALKIDRYTPVLSMQRTTFDGQERPVELVYSAYRGDHYQFRAMLRHSEWTAERVKGNPSRDG